MGRWGRTGGTFRGGHQIQMLTEQGTIVASGTMIGSNLYSLLFSKPTKNVGNELTFVTTSKCITWETLHNRFGHVSYKGLTTLMQRKLVDGLCVDLASPKPDCVACTEAKHFICPFPRQTDRNYTPGELTHIDLWGQYEIASIHKSLYYILMVDDASRFVTVEFLKSKDKAADEVKSYLTYVSVREKTPKAIRVDRGTEFVNAELVSWCKERGISIQQTAPYSPSQNGVAERMNRTLMELARAMLTAA